MVQDIGVVGIILLFTAILALTGRRRWWWPVLSVLTVGAVLDSSFFLFPSWYVPAALLATVGWNVSRDQVVESAHEGDSAHQDVPLERFERELAVGR